MIDKKLIKNFETISKFDNLSRYSRVLDREFREKTLKEFIISLKNYKTKEKENFIEEFHKKYPYQHEEKEIVLNNDTFFENIIKSKTRNENELKSVNNNHLTLSNSVKKAHEIDSPEPWRYNPNYDSIYKNIPSFKMFYNNKAEKNHLKHKINKILKSKIFENNKLNDNANNKSNDNSKDNKIKPETKNINLFKTNIKINDSKNKYTNKKNIFFSLPQITFKNINNSKEEKDKHKKFNTLEAKNNKKISLSEFNKYKYNGKSVEDDYQTNYKISNIHHYNNNIINNNFVNFRKMSSRNYKFLINSYSLDIPSSDKYNPKYSYIENNVKNIKFTPFGLNKNNKKFLLKKMMNSYNVPTEYQFIDNEKLSNDNELINRQLILNHNIYPLK